MSTVARDRDLFTEASLSACLFENPYRLVSLSDMLRVLTYDFCRASGIIGQMYAQVQSGVIVSEGAWGSVAGELGTLERACVALGLTNTLAQILRIKDNFFAPKPFIPGVLARDIMEVHTRLIDELQSRMFFVIPPDRVVFYDAVDYFGIAVEEAFASANFDISEAAKCYALSRNTACVFHLMRVLEIGLGSLARKFDAPYDHTNWETILNRIEKKIAEIEKSPNRPANWKDEREFHSQCASHFRVVKDAWRNYTAHARGKYDEQEAFDMLTSVRGFMQRLATKLRE